MLPCLTKIPMTASRHDHFLSASGPPFSSTLPRLHSSSWTVRTIAKFFLDSEDNSNDDHDPKSSSTTQSTILEATSSICVYPLANVLSQKCQERSGRSNLPRHSLTITRNTWRCRCQRPPYHQKNRSTSFQKQGHWTTG